MDAICQKHSSMIGPAVCLHCEIESLRRRLQDGSPVVEGTIQYMAMEIAALKKALNQARADALREAAATVTLWLPNMPTVVRDRVSEELRRTADEMEKGK